jgi:phosphate-selective porin
VINADRAATDGAELPWTLGPYGSQAEVMASRVDSSTAGRLNFNGLYAQAGWFITGDSHPCISASSRMQAGAPGRL